MRNARDRLRRYLETTVLPRVASRLGAGWTAQGLTLSSPEGLRFPLFLSPWDPNPVILIYAPALEDDSFEEKPMVELSATATAISIATAVKEVLLPECSPETASAYTHAEAATSLDFATPATGKASRSTP
jgi:hypothetical protein